MNKKNLTGLEKFAYGIGAVAKDMVFMLAASYILYYYQDIMGVSAWVMGIILMIARVLDAFNAPIMGVIVAKTNSRWGRFRPWVFIGTLLNAFVLYFMFACPPNLNGAGLAAYAAASYILWGVTYTMMDIPFWSMIPAFTESGSERENLSALARSCAGLGSSIISIVTVMTVSAIGTALGGTTSREVERLGFKYFALIIAVIFVVFMTITCLGIKEKSNVNMKSASVRDMFRALIKNDQAIILVITIVIINTALYTPQNLLIYFFKYDFCREAWQTDYALFNTCCGAFQILAMMILFKICRNFMNTMKIFSLSMGMAMAGYMILLIIAVSGSSDVYLLLIPAFLIMAAIGMLNVIVTVFLANMVDYGEFMSGRRDESVIFSMQTFVVKLASGISALIASIVLTAFNISSDEDMTVSSALAAGQKLGLRTSMTILPVIILVIGFIVFKRHYILTDEKLSEILDELHSRRDRNH